jgi:hypothetical protein
MAAEVVLNGELGLLSLFDLGQLLMLNGATGEMSVTHDGRRGYLYFVRGQIVNAVDDEYHEGEGAAYRLFTWKRGAFEFRPAPPTGSRAISDSTEGLMMEAARRMDEDGTGEDTSVADRLARRASSLDALRLAFDSVAHQARPMPDVNDPAGSPFDLLQSSADALLLRPNDLPRIRLTGRWRSSGTQPLEPGAFEQLRGRLLDGARPGTPESGVVTWVALHENGRRYDVTHLAGEREALWIRRADVAPPAASQLEGPVDAWRALLAARAGLLLVCGPDAESADRLLHACVAQMLRERPGTLLLAADHGRWQHSDEQGALLRASGAETAPLLRALAPDAAAFDHAHAEASADALHVAARVAVAIVAPDPATAITRWCARIGRRWGDGIEALLAHTPVDVVHATAEPGADGHVPFGLCRLVAGDAATEACPSGEAPAARPAAAEPPPASPAAPAPALAPAGTGTDEAAPAVHADPMAALAAELTRTLKQAA